MSLITAKQIEGIYVDQLLNNKLNGTVDPTVSQDISQGYDVSSIWVNITASPRRAFYCVDNSLGAAVWRQYDENLPNTAFVSSTGHDTNGNGSIVNPYLTIQKAIDVMSLIGGTVYIDSGTYTENLNITDSVTLKAIALNTVTITGKLTINNTSNNPINFEGLNLTNSTDNTVSHESTTGHQTNFINCNIAQTGSGAFNAVNITATTGDTNWKNTSISVSDSTGGSKAVYTDPASVCGMLLFDCFVTVNDNTDAVVVELNGTAGFIFVGKNIQGQTVAQGDGFVLLSYGGITTSTVPVLVTTMATQPAIILNANIISSANPCVIGTGTFLFGNIIFFNGIYLDYAGTLSGGSGAIAIKIDSAMGLRYRNALTGLTATNIQDAIDEIYALIPPPSTGNAYLGYNNLQLSFAGDQLNYQGETNANGTALVLTPGSITISGGTPGWFYVVVDSAGVVTFQTIPVAEIVADTQQYTPTPVFNNTLNAYYSSTTPTKRIVAIGFWDTVNILEVIPYGNGSNTNDDYYRSNGDGTIVSSSPSRLQYTPSFQLTRGKNITVVDNGAGSSDSNGFRVTANKVGELEINIGLQLTAPAQDAFCFVYVNKNGSIFKNLNYVEVNVSATSVTIYSEYSIKDTVQEGDYFTFYIGTNSVGGSAKIMSPSIRFKELS